MGLEDAGTMDCGMKRRRTMDCGINNCECERNVCLEEWPGEKAREWKWGRALSALAVSRNKR